MPDERRKDLKRCPMCSGWVGTAVKFSVVGEGGMNPMHMAACQCGLHSKMFDSIQDLEHWWETRSGREPKKPELKVTHASREISGIPF